MYALKTQQKSSSSNSLIKYKESDLLLHDGEKMFALITDIENYPEFLPGWLSVKVVSRDDKQIVARQTIGMPFVHWDFTSVAIMEKPTHIQITSTDSPFQFLDIHWNIQPMTRNLSRVTLNVVADIDSNVRPLWNVIIKQSVHSLLEHFKQRALRVYGYPA